MTGVYVLPDTPSKVPWSFPQYQLNGPDMRSISPLIVAFASFLTNFAAFEPKDDKKLEFPELCKVTSHAPGWYDYACLLRTNWLGEQLEIPNAELERPYNNFDKTPEKKTP
ncbi:hypothetical protein CGLO_01219 [Colletotrichum gloeosporioides Cg-14]|uniref:Uncharacterized protein n=1 Tax=Colletotrichum gloeosporioides (strain Cg-14) TaxID=1237896 RepID=T0L274_COLGC|nr:hypothetical protein CGLO_01219 [Colletotrichum gloeosporioides Cg-14]